MVRCCVTDACAPFPKIDWVMDKRENPISSILRRHLAPFHNFVIKEGERVKRRATLILPLKMLKRISICSQQTPILLESAEYKTFTEKIHRRVSVVTKLPRARQPSRLFFRAPFKAFYEAHINSGRKKAATLKLSPLHGRSGLHS